jgi:hypothetical protein
VEVLSVQASRSKFFAIAHKMNNSGDAQRDNTLCAVCEVHSQLVEALNSTLIEWGLVDESRTILAPHHDCVATQRLHRGSAFVDGWMEEVSYSLLIARTSSGSGMPPGMSSRLVAGNSDSIEKAASRVQLERHAGGDSRLRAQEELGAEAARILRRFFESCAPEEQEVTRKRAALGQLVSLSFRIQGTPTSPAGLHRIVNSCLLAGQCGVTFMRLPERAELLRLLTQPIVDVAKWVHRLESLWRTFPI